MFVFILKYLRHDMCFALLLVAFFHVSIRSFSHINRRTKEKNLMRELSYIFVIHSRLRSPPNIITGMSKLKKDEKTFVYEEVIIIIIHMGVTMCNDCNLLLARLFLFYFAQEN